MERRRILEVSTVRPIEVREGAIYETYNQDSFLESFDRIYPSEPQTLTLIQFFFANNPVVLKVDVAEFRRLMLQELGEVPSDQFCLHEGKERPSDLGALLPSSGREVSGIVLAHILIHILLFYAIRCREPISKDEPEDFVFEERVRENPFNPSNEAIGVFNFPARTPHVHILADFIADYLHQWAQGEETRDFQVRMRDLAKSLDLSRTRTS